MLMQRRSFLKAFFVVTLSLVFLPGAQAAFSQANAGAKPAVTAAKATSGGANLLSPEDLADTREQLLSLLRMSPTLQQTVAADPTLLADQEYINRTNPQLAEFLVQHPEITRNPDFYLFANLTTRGGRHVDVLRRRGVEGDREQPSEQEERRRFLLNMLQVPMFLVVLGALVWLIRILLENRRWGRLFRMQSEVHTKLIDRFASSDELLQYMSTEPGKRFLEAAPIPVDFEHDQRLPGALSRVLAPLQIGIVLTLLGLGLLALRHSLRDHSMGDLATPLLVSGVVLVMPGIGFILSAGITWMISVRLGLMPESASKSIELSDRK